MTIDCGSVGHNNHVTAAALRDGDQQLQPENLHPASQDACSTFIHAVRFFFEKKLPVINKATRKFIVVEYSSHES